MKGTIISVESQRRVVKVNGEEIPFADGMTGRSISVNGNSVTIDGYRLQEGVWQKTEEKPRLSLKEMLSDILFG